MAEIHEYKQPTDRAYGPEWQNELLERLHTDMRFREQLHGATSWGDIPLGQLVNSAKPVQPSLCYYTSSSTGAPKQVVFTQDDWHECVTHRADCLAELGLGREHLVSVVLPFGPWFSGDNISQSLLHLGAGVLPAGMYEPHILGVTRLMSSVGANALITTPSIARNMMHSPFLSKLDKLVLVGEAVTSSIRTQLADHFGAVPRCLYAASEAILGVEVADKPKEFRWDNNRLHLEVLTPGGNIAELGSGELLISKRYGSAMPLLRYPLNDLVELSRDPDSGSHFFKYLGRCGHAFGLATGVKVGRAHVERFLDEIPTPIHEVHITVDHAPKGDRMHILLGGSNPLPEPDEVRERFLSSSLDVMDAYRSGFLHLDVETYNVPMRAKRYLHITETPWRM